MRKSKLVNFERVLVKLQIQESEVRLRKQAAVTAAGLVDALIGKIQDPHSLQPLFALKAKYQAATSF